MSQYKNHSDKLNKIEIGELSLRDNVADFLNSIKNNSSINAFNFVFDDDALQSANTIEKKIKTKKIGNLFIS